MTITGSLSSFPCPLPPTKSNSPQTAGTSATPRSIPVGVPAPADSLREAYVLRFGFGHRSTYLNSYRDSSGAWETVDLNLAKIFRRFETAQKTAALLKARVLRVLVDQRCHNPRMAVFHNPNQPSQAPMLQEKGPSGGVLRMMHPAPFRPLTSLELLCKLTVESGGGIFAGVQRGFRAGAKHCQSLALFNSPETRATSALPLSELSSEAVRRAILASNQKFKRSTGDAA